MIISNEQWSMKYEVYNRRMTLAVHILLIVIGRVMPLLVSVLPISHVLWPISGIHGSRQHRGKE